MRASKDVGWLVVASMLLACGSGDDTSGSAGGGTGTGTGAALGSGDGTCASPLVIEPGFDISIADTSLGTDDAAPSCIAEPGLPENAYALTLTEETTLTITGSDESGAGFGYEIREGGCQGVPHACEWKSNGVFDETVTLGAGTWTLIVERVPAGAFTIAVD